MNRSIYCVWMHIPVWIKFSISTRFVHPNEFFHLVFAIRRFVMDSQGRLRPIETLVRKGREGIGTRVAHEDGGNQKPKRKNVNEEDEVIIYPFQRDGMGWNGMGWDGMDGMGWDGNECVNKTHSSCNPCGRQMIRIIAGEPHGLTICGRTPRLAPWIF